MSFIVDRMNVDTASSIECGVHGRDNINNLVMALAMNAGFRPQSFNRFDWHIDGETLVWEATSYAETECKP